MEKVVESYGHFFYADSNEKMEKRSIVIDRWFLASGEEMESPSSRNVEMVALVKEWRRISRCDGCAWTVLPASLGPPPPRAVADRGCAQPRSTSGLAVSMQLIVGLVHPS